MKYSRFEASTALRALSMLRRARERQYRGIGTLSVAPHTSTSIASLTKKRGLQFHVWTEPNRVEEELAELHGVPKTVKSRLEGVRTVIALEYGLSQAGSMLEVVGFEIAYRLAETHDGVIKADDGAWFDHDAHRWDAFK